MTFKQTLWEQYKNRALKDAKKQLTNIQSFVPCTLAFVITSRCNFACKHCLRNSNYEKDLPFDILEKTIIDAKKYNFKYAGLTGGEPFLYPKLKEALELFNKYDYMFSAVTNGYNFKNYTELLVTHRKRINFIAFSLESMNKEKHDNIRKTGSFDKLLENFQICRDLRIPFRIITAVSTVNYDEIFDLAVFSKKKGAQAFTATTVLPCPRSDDNKMTLTSEKRQELFLLLRQIGKTIKFPILIGADIRANHNLKLCNSLDFKEITIDMDGNLLQCCELSNFDDDNIKEQAKIASLKDVSFDNALKIASKFIHNFDCMRIEDYIKQENTESVNFNSCFYCIKKLSTIK